MTIAMSQIYACYFDIKHVENERYTELPVPNSVTSSIPYQKGFLSFSIFTATDGQLAYPKNTQGVYNSKDYFDFGFIVVGDDLKETKIPAIQCSEAVEKYIESDAIRN